jgi:FkbM family methyltransferase
MEESLMIDLLLLQNAAHYDVGNESERRRSNEDLISLFYMLQDRIRPELTVEIGAFNAKFSIDMRRRGFRAIALEANPHNFEHFRKDPELASSGVEYLHLAISGTDGFIDFQLQKKVAGVEADPVRGNNSILIRNTDGIEYDVINVPSASLAGFFRNHGLDGKSFSAWIDVEGAMGEVLDGADAALDSCLTLLVEVEQHRFWRDQRLVTHVMDLLIRRNLIPIARDFEYAHQYNMIFVRRELLESAVVRDALALYHSRVGQRKVAI